MTDDKSNLQEGQDKEIKKLRLKNRALQEIPKIYHVPQEQSAEFTERLNDILGTGRNAIINAIEEQGRVIEELKDDAAKVFGSIILEKMNDALELNQHAKETLDIMQDLTQKMRQKTPQTAAELLSLFDSDKWDGMQTALAESMQKTAELTLMLREFHEIIPYLEAELKNPKYGGKNIFELELEAGDDEDSLFEQAMSAARAARERIAAQNAGRLARRQTRERAKQEGAIMTLQNDALPTFSRDDLWDAFAPSRISRLGTLPKEVINENTGKIDKIQLADGEIIPTDAFDLPTKGFLLINAIMLNSVDSAWENLIKNKEVTFYVKGVLDKLEIDPRIKDDQQLTIDFRTGQRKTAGALYLEKLFEPLVTLIGTTPDGSRYSVFNYIGYDLTTDTMKIRSPYLSKLWEISQKEYWKRERSRQLRIEDGKRPLKKDLAPLKINAMLKPAAYKEDNAVLDMVIYITNVLLAAGKGKNKKTEIKLKTLIENSPHLKAKLEEIEQLPRTGHATKANKKPQNNSARYNTELRKIERAYHVIMDPKKCRALEYFKFKKFVMVTTDGGEIEFRAPTKSILSYKIRIEWERINVKE